MASQPVKLLTLNCNGLNNRIKSKRVLSILLKSGADIIFLQETHLRRSDLSVFKTKRFPVQIQAHGTSKSKGVAILISSRLRAVIISHKADPNGRFLFLNVHIEGESFTLASLYAPNDHSVDFVADSLKILESFCTGPVIAGGDLNCLMDWKMDYSGDRKSREYDGWRGKQTDSLNQLLSLYHLQDVWRRHHPIDRDYTFFSPRHTSHSRLDYILASDSILESFIYSETGLRLWSDHSAVEGRFSLKNKMSHPPQWRLNADLLTLEPIHLELERELISYFELNRDCGVKATLIWDAMKAVIRGKCISITSTYLKKRRAYKETILNQIKNLEEHHKRTCSSKTYQRLLEERKKLEALETKAIQRKLLYTKQKYWLKSPKTL